MRDTIFKTAVKYFALVSSVYFSKPDESISKIFYQYICTFSPGDDSIEMLKKYFTEWYKSFVNEPLLFEDQNLGDQLFISTFENHFSETLLKIDLSNRFILILLVLDFFYETFPEREDDNRYIELMAKRFGISHEEFSDCCRLVKLRKNREEKSNNILVFKPAFEKKEALEGSWIEKNIPEGLKKAFEIEEDFLKCNVEVLFIDRLKIFILTCSNPEYIAIEGEDLSALRYGIVRPGYSIMHNNRHFTNFRGLKSFLLKYRSGQDISLYIENISYAGKSKKNALRNFSAFEDTGKLIGILGKEGVGKSTLLEIIAGRIPPATGKIRINGYHLEKNKYLLKNIIGFVSEEDMLFDELSVFDNLILHSRLFYSRLSERALEARINKVLEQTDLLEIRNRIVGSVFDKNIQPGQRRMLNIALELIREPKILLVDNAIYGLGTAESSQIIKVLSDYTFRGNLVITTLTQTSTKAFNLFDTLWILDENGYPVYNGESSQAPGYFIENLKNPELTNTVIECTPEYILDLVGFRISDLSGRTGKRMVLPEEWHHLFLEKNKIPAADKDEKIPLPSEFIKMPNLETQFRLFSFRNFKIKFSNTRKIIYLILAGPLIAFLLSVIFRESGSQYLFYLNNNIPLFFFASVIISLLLGLIMSSKEILNERNILTKEIYHEFSRFSYINSKISFLFIIGAFQTFLFALTSTGIIGLKNFLFPFWLTLYSICCFGILFGLILSSAHSNLKNIYERSIPVFLALQIFLGGGLITYKNLNLGETPFVPLAGELMVARWGYEALAVHQFKNNEFEQKLYPYDSTVSQAAYYSRHFIPILQNYTGLISEEKINKDSSGYYLRILQNGLNQIVSDGKVFPYEYADKLNKKEITLDILEETKDYLTYVDLFYIDRYEEALHERENRILFLKDSLGTEFVSIRNNYHNRSLEQLVTNSKEPLSWKIIGGKIVQLSDPVFQNPRSNFGRAALFVPEKKFRGEIIDTFWFNMMVIWSFSLVLFVILMIDLPSGIAELFDHQKFNFFITRRKK